MNIEEEEEEERKAFDKALTTYLADATIAVQGIQAIDRAMGAAQRYVASLPDTCIEFQMWLAAKAHAGEMNVASELLEALQNLLADAPAAGVISVSKARSLVGRITGVAETYEPPKMCGPAKRDLGQEAIDREACRNGNWK